MYAVERLSSYITRGVYTVSAPFHPFGGAVDIIVVQQQDGTFKSSPWNVRFGKFQGVLKTKEKIVNVCVNGTDAQFHMYLDHTGEAYFLKDPIQDEGDSFLSPPSSGDETDGLMKSARLRKAQSCNHGGSCRESIGGVFNVENDKMIAVANSQPPRIFGFVFGRRTVKEGGNGGETERVSSLQRAEIAADLLEVKWSTSLLTSDQMGCNSLKLPSDGDRLGNAVDGEQRLAMQPSDGGFVHGDRITNQHEEISDKNESKIVTAGHIDEPLCNGYPKIRSFEEVIKISSSETGELAHDNEVLSSSPKAVDFDVSFKESVIVNPTVNLYSHDFHKLLSDKDCHLPAGLSGEGNGDTEETEVSSYFYCETSESSSVMHDVSASAALEVLNSVSVVGGQDQITSEHMNDTDYQSYEEYNRCKPGPSTMKENYDEHCNENQDCNDNMGFMQTGHAFGGPCEKPVATTVGHPSMESLSSHDLSLQILQPIQTETVDVIHQDALEEETSLENAMDSDVLEISKSLCETCEHSVKLSYDMAGYNVDRQCSSSKEGKFHSNCFPTATLNTSVKVHEPHYPVDIFKFGKRDFFVEDITTEEYNSSLHMSEIATSSISLPDSLKEDEFLFNEGDISGSKEHQARSLTAEEILAEDFPSIVPEGGLGDHESTDTREHAYYVDNSVESKVQASSIFIPKLKRIPKEKEHWVGSLPNIRSQIHELERSDVHPTSHSLHIMSKPSMWSMPEKDISSFLSIESGPESNLLQPQPIAVNAPDMQKGGEQSGMSICPAVEISLCRHLLFEGMGAEEASKVFDAEKVDLESFAALDPSLGKNDKLVVRINGRYFPWNSAASIILGIVSFGHEGIFDAKSMIAVDRTDKTPEQDPSRAIVPFGGAWRLWPFNFKKARGINPTHLAPGATGTTEKGTKAISVDNKMINDNNVQRSRVMKKKVRSTMPTSEQLASLNLKEGQNLVTFSFSTAMLGRQQVDARIYLWQWNTRIVVSDVDGTITKSDVLGQFMPLVGKDWSQTGVAHLFSAIKENGYQLLFLSARAISQAYLTRQFLFNIKQDGKVLPDGPVVISPDGLFPSLYREVIRRAPHEFKISCLEEIRALFPPECNPFYAGFGNRDTDEISYLKVGIPKGKIFIINPKGEVAVNHRVDTKSYTSLHALVNAMFPAMPSAEQEDFNSWNYWKMPLPKIDI